MVITVTTNADVVAVDGNAPSARRFRTPDDSRTESQGEWWL
jgi:hypothetical protein